jgi:hypothetical protein
MRTLRERWYNLAAYSYHHARAADNATTSNDYDNVDN